MKRLHLFLAGIVLALAPLQALAAETVSIPVGDWIVALAGWAMPLVGTVLMGVVGWAVAKLPPAFGGVANMLLTEQILKRATDFAQNAVAGAAQGKAISFQVGNAVVAEALRYAANHAPEWFAKIDADLLRQKIIARLNLAPDAKVTPAGQIVPAA